MILMGVVAAAGCQLYDWQSSEGMGRTDVLKKAPFYVDYGTKRGGNAGGGTTTTVGCIAIAIDRTGRTFLLDAGGEAALQPLLAAMNARMEKSGRCKPLTEAALPEKGAPVIYAGSNDGEGAAPRYDEGDDGHESRMILSVQSPSKSWRTDLARVLQENAVQELLIIQLGLADYPQSSKRVFGKRVILGTGYERELKFLTRTDQQIPVLQVTGMRLDRDGRILRAGAEGIIHRESGFVTRMVLGATELLSPEELHNAPLARREDLPGRPFKWEVALDELVKRLL